MLLSCRLLYRILSVASDAPVRGTGFTPGRSSPGAIALLHAAPDAPTRDVFLSSSLRCLGRSSPGCLFIVLFIVFSPLPRTLQSVAPGSPPDDPVRGLAPCFIPPRMLQSWASFCHILSAAWDAPVRGTGFTPGRCSPRASAVLLPAPAAPTRGVFLSYSLRCLGRSSPRHRVQPRPIQSRGLRRASFPPGCSNPGGLFVVLSPPPRTLQSVAPGSPPDDPVRGLMLCFIPPRQLHSGASFCRILSVASDAPVRGTGFTPGRSSPGASAVFLPAPVAPTRGVFLSYSLRCLGRSSPRHRVHPRTIQSGGLRRASFPPGCSNPGGLFVVLSPPPRTLQSVAPGSPPDNPVRGLLLCFIPPRQLHSGASFCRILPVASDASVRGTGFTPGRSSPGARAVLPLAPDAPIRGVMFLSLLADFRVCVRGASVFRLFFFRAPIVVVPPPLSTLRSAFPAPSPPSPPPVLSSPAPFLSLCVGFAGARTKAPSVYARMLLCFGAGTHVHSSSPFPAFVHVQCSSVRPFPCHMHFVLPLPTSCPLLFCLFGARTQAPTPTHAICHHSHLAFNHSFCTLAARLFCVSSRVDIVGDAAAISPLASLPTVSGFLLVLLLRPVLASLLFFFRPSLGVLALCIHGMLCYLFFMSWTLCFLQRPRVSESYCLLGGTRYLLYGARTLCFWRRPRVSVVFLMLSCHVTFALCLGLFVFCDTQE